jgi:hypothetical protein
MNTGPDALGTAENELGAKNMKTGPDASVPLKMSLERKTSMLHLTSSVPLKTSSGAKNMNMGLEALDTDENESGSAKHENGNRRPCYRRK